MEDIFISDDYITLGQFLKLANIIQSGGHVKVFLLENKIYVNDEKEDRRGKKLYINDIIKIDDVGAYIIKHKM